MSTRPNPRLAQTRSPRGRRGSANRIHTPTVRTGRPPTDAGPHVIKNWHTEHKGAPTPGTTCRGRAAQRDGQLALHRQLRHDHLDRREHSALWAAARSTRIPTSCSTCSCPCWPNCSMLVGLRGAILLIAAKRQDAISAAWPNTTSTPTSHRRVRSIGYFNWASTSRCWQSCTFSSNGCRPHRPWTRSHENQSLQLSGLTHHVSACTPRPRSTSHHANLEQQPA